MVSMVLRAVMGVLLIGTLAVAQERRHNEARFDTMGGKSVIKLYSYGKLDTIIVLDKKKPAATGRTSQLMQRKRTNDLQGDWDTEWYKRRSEEYARQAKEYARKAEQYARQAERYARRALEFAQQHGRSQNDSLSSPPLEHDENFVFPPPAIVPPPEIPNDAKLRRQLEKSIQQFKRAWEEYRRLIPQLHDTTKLERFSPNQIEQLDEAMRRWFDTALKTLEQYSSLSNSIRRWTKEVESQLERLRELLKQYRDDDNYP